MAQHVFYTQVWSSSDNLREIKFEAEKKCREFFGTMEGVDMYLDVEPLLVHKARPLKVEMRAERFVD